MKPRSYSDDELAEAIVAARSWRGVLRSLGLNEASAGTMRSARRRADSLELSYEHFTGGRTWSDVQLATAVRDAFSWTHVASLLGLVPEGGTLTALHAHALRRRLPIDHLEGKPAEPATIAAAEFNPKHLRDAGSLFAATWFSLRGAKVAWPLEPCRYDLVADDGAELCRVQVKTTTAHGPGALAHISNSRRSGRAIYGPGEIDAFFILDADPNAYLIPYRNVAGYGAIQLNNYVNFRVVERGRLIPEAA